LTSDAGSSIMIEGRSERTSMLSDQRDRFLARSRLVDERRAKASALKGSSGPKAKRSTERAITAHTVHARWKEAQLRVFPDMINIPWTKTQLAMAKKLIERLGGETALRYVDLVFDGWTDIVKRNNFRGYPTMQWCLGFLDSIGQELLTGTKIGKDKIQSMNPRTRALEKGEFNERTSSREKDIGWDD
jgi:hypothetical protein